MKKCLMIILMLMVCCAKENTPKDGVIRVNDTWIKKDNVERIMEIYKQEMMRASPQQALEGLPATFKKSVARQLVATEVMLQEAKKRAIGYDSAVAVKMIDDIKKRFPDSASLDRELAKMGQTRKDMWQQAKDGLMVDSLIKTLLKHVDTVSAAACKEYYDNNMAKLASEKRYRVSQIMFVAKKGMAADKKNLIAQKAEKVLAEVKAGKDFAAAARKYSEDGLTAKSGGDIGWFKRGDFKKEFDLVAMSLKQDEVSNVFETDVGFHIFKKTGEEALPPPPYDQVKDQIKNTILLKKQNDVVKHFVDSLVTKTKITYADTSYKMEEGFGSR
jgi:parvulin-like peptidyl-prolyl isomerase